ncbi:MAG: hypothetical protein HYW50_03910 [Candidatus Diapherotrites archaeon]|nr:hypothetical protein [Candidatus Diapherotrites archaeon]
MAKPTRRRISPAARDHINQARAWKNSSALHKKAAETYATDIVASTKSLFSSGKRPSAQKVRSTQRASRRLIRLTKNALSAALNARETAREHIGAAKDIVERQNPSSTARRGRRHRQNLF